MAMIEFLLRVNSLFEKTKYISEHPKIIWDKEQSFTLIVCLSILFKFLKEPTLERVRPNERPLIRESNALILEIEDFIRNLEAKLTSDTNENIIRVDEKTVNIFISRFDTLAKNFVNIEYPDLINSYSLLTLHNISLKSDDLQWEGLPIRVKGGLLSISEFLTLEAQEKLNYLDQKIRVSVGVVTKAGKDIEKAINDFEKFREKAGKDITAINENAHSIMKRIDEMQLTFEGFMESKSRFASEIGKLEQRSEQIQEVISQKKAQFENFDGFVKILEEKEIEAQKILDSMQEAQQASTSLKLSKIFSENAERITSEISAVRWRTLFSSILLFVFSLPLIVYVLSPFVVFIIPLESEVFEKFNSYARSNANSGWDVVGDILVRIGILLPAAWLFLIWNKRYNILLQLREHYEYKNAIAVSIEGLKAQSKRYSDEIITHLVTELASDPARIMSRSSGRKDISESIIAKLVQPIQDPLSTDSGSDKS